MLRATITIVLLIGFTGCDDASVRQNSKVMDPSKPGSVAYLDARYGFREVRFGQSPAEIRGLELIERQAEWGKAKYKRETEDRQLGPICLGRVIYVFYENHLYTIQIERTSDDEGMLKLLTEAYGPPTSRRTDGRLYWEGNRVRLLYWGGRVEFIEIGILEQASARFHGAIDQEKREREQQIKDAARGL